MSGTVLSPSHIQCNSHNNPMLQVLLLFFPFYRWKNWGKEWWRLIPSIISFVTMGEESSGEEKQDNVKVTDPSSVSAMKLSLSVSKLQCGDNFFLFFYNALINLRYLYICNHDKIWKIYNFTDSNHTYRARFSIPH